MHVHIPKWSEHLKVGMDDEFITFQMTCVAVTPVLTVVATIPFTGASSIKSLRLKSEPTSMSGVVNNGNLRL